MTKQFLTLAATTAMVLAFSSQLFAQVDEQLVLTATVGVTTATATIQLLANGTLEYSCAGTAAACGDFAGGGATAGHSLGFPDGGSVSDDSQNGTLSITNAIFNGYQISDTASGWVDSTIPTLQTFNQVTAKGGKGTVSAIFTDIDYNTPGTPLSSELNAADSNVTDSGISGSTIQFTVLDDPLNSVPATHSLYTNTLTGASASNGANGVNFSNPYTTGSVSISSALLLTFTGTGKIQANMTVANVGSVPEPASTVLLGSMILGLTGLIRKKKVKRS